MQDDSKLQSGENGKPKCSLFDRLKKAIEAKDSGTAKGILTNGDENLQEVLGTSIIEKDNDGTTESFTFLTYAIEFGEIDVAQAILENASDDVLTELLSVQSIIQLANGTKKFTALSLAKKYDKEKAYADLAKKIKAKIDELGIPDKERRTSNNLFWAVLWRDGRAVNNILESSRKQGDITQILKAGLIGLCIGDKRAQALATKGDREIIRDIKTGQAFAISIIGLTTVVFAVAAIALILLTDPVPMTTAPIIGIVIAGFMGVGGVASVGFAVFHDSHKIPDSKVERVETDNTAQVHKPC